MLLLLHSYSHVYACWHSHGAFACMPYFEYMWHQPTQQQLPICPRWRCVYRCTCTRVRVQDIERTLCEDISYLRQPVENYNLTVRKAVNLTWQNATNRDSRPVQTARIAATAVATATTLRLTSTSNPPPVTSRTALWTRSSANY